MRRSPALTVRRAGAPLPQADYLRPPYDAPGGRDWQPEHLLSTCGTAARPGRDFARDFGVTYPSIFDPPERTLLALKKIPRSAVTIVLDRQHRVAAVFLHAVHAQVLQPVVQWGVTEP